MCVCVCVCVCTRLEHLPCKLLVYAAIFTSITALLTELVALLRGHSASILKVAVTKFLAYATSFEGHCVIENAKTRAHLYKYASAYGEWVCLLPHRSASCTCSKSSSD